MESLQEDDAIQEKLKELAKVPSPAMRTMTFHKSYKDVSNSIGTFYCLLFNSYVIYVVLPAKRLSTFLKANNTFLKANNTFFNLQPIIENEEKTPANVLIKKRKSSRNLTIDHSKILTTTFHQISKRDFSTNFMIIR